MSDRLHIHEHWSLTVLLHRTLDAVWIGLSLLLALLIEHERHELMLCITGAITVYWLFAEVSGLYRMTRGVPLNQEFYSLILTWFAGCLTLTCLAFINDLDAGLLKYEILRWFILQLGGFMATRVIVRWIQYILRTRGINTRSYAVVGVNELGFELARNIEHSVELGLKLTGFYDDRESERLPTVPAQFGHHVGNLDELVAAAKNGAVQQIYITFPMRAEKRINRVLSKLSDTTASVYVVPDFFVFELLHSRWTHIGGLPAVSVFENPFYGVDGVFKRILDLVVGSLILVCAAIPMALIALGIKFTSPGPIFFRQRRYGLDGKEIRVWKFRSMRVTENGAIVTQATQDDPRVTPFGRFLRKTSLDELPQLFNVIEGTMSLVGPRPHATAHNEQYRKLIPGYMLRHKVKPGITGLAQVNGWRGETDTDYKMQKRIEFDHKYIREWSPWLDVRILFKTITTVIRGNNAY